MDRRIALMCEAQRMPLMLSKTPVCDLSTLWLAALAGAGTAIQLVNLYLLVLIALKVGASG
jgi:hypothetical protein